MRRFLVWAAVLSTALLVSATDTTVAKPIERKKDTKPRGWMLAGDLAGDEEIAEQHQSGGYLRGSETAAPLAYTDKTSVSTTEKASASYTAKPNSPSSASYGEKTAGGATTASPTTTSTAAVKQGVGVSSVVVPWGSVTAKTPADSNTEAPTPSLQHTGTTAGGLYGAGVKVDNPTAPTIAEKITAGYNAKTEESPPSASYGETTAAPLTTLPPPTAQSNEKASTSPYSATDALKQGGVVSNVIVPWGTVTSNTPSYSTTKGPAPTERIEENGGGGAYDTRVKAHDAIPVTDNKGGAKQSDSNLHESPAENKASDSKFDLPQSSSTISATVEKTAPSIGPDATSTSNDYTSAPLSGIASATRAKGVAVAMKTSDDPAADAPTSTTNNGGGAENDNHESITDTRDPITGNRGSARSDSWVARQASTDKRGGSIPTQKADPLYSVKPSSQYDHKVASPLEDKTALPDTSDVESRDDEKAWPRASETSSGSYNSKPTEAANSAPYVSPSGDKHGDVASDVEDRKHSIGVGGSTPDIDKSKEVWGHDSVQPRSSDDDKTGQLREYVPPPGQSNEDVHPRHSSGRSSQRDEEGATTYSETNISTNTDGGEASYPTNNAGSEHPSLSDHGKIIYQDDVKHTVDTSATKHGADNENYGSKSGFDTAAPTPRWSKHGEDREDDKNNGNANDGNYANSAEAPGQEKRNAWAKSTGGDSGFHGDTAQTPSESTMTYGSEVDAPAGGKTRSSYSENENLDSPAEHKGRGEEEQSSNREKSSSSEGGGKHRGRVEELTVPWRQEAPSSPGYSSNPAPTSEVKKQSDETGNDAAKETTNSEPAHDRPVYDGALGRVVPWNDGKPQLVIDTAKAKPTPSPYHAGAEAPPEEQTESRDYGHLFDDLVPWKASHSRLRRELQAEDNEQPAEQPAAEETHDKPEEVPADKPADDNTVVDQPGEEKSAEQQPADQPTETSAEHPSEHAETADADEVMKTTAVVDENVRWNQDDCNPCDVPTQPPTSAPLYPRKDDDYEQQLPNVTDEYKSWDHVKEEPEPASTKPPKKKRAYKPPKADLIRCTKIIGEYGESYECENEATQPPPPDTPYESTPSPEPPTEPPQETPAPTATEPPQETPAPATTEPPTEAPYEPTSTPQPSDPATTSPPTENTPAPTKPSEPTPAPSKPGEPTPAPSQPSEPTPAPSKPSEPTPSPTKPGQATPAPTKAFDDSKSTPVSTSKGTSTFPTGTKATTSKTATPAATAGPSTPAATSVDTSTGNTAYGTSGTTGGSNEKVVGASTSEGNSSSGSSDPLSGGAIAGIVIACVVFAAVVVGAVLYRQRSIARQREENLFADLAAGAAGRALETDYAAM